MSKTKNKQTEKQQQQQQQQQQKQCFWGLIFVWAHGLRTRIIMSLKFYGSAERELKLKVRKFWRPIQTFAGFTGKN